jgi:hypothetical protein
MDRKGQEERKEDYTARAERGQGDSKREERH